MYKTNKKKQQIKILNKRILRYEIEIMFFLKKQHNKDSSQLGLTCEPLDHEHKIIVTI